MTTGTKPEVLSEGQWSVLRFEATAVSLPLILKLWRASSRMAGAERPSRLPGLRAESGISMSKVIEFPVQQPNADHFGGCPRCHSYTCHRNVGAHRFVCCDRHRLCWHLGFGLFSDWLHESDELHREIDALLRTYRIVDPWFPRRATA
jgi:hypothetical protein